MDNNRLQFTPLQNRLITVSLTLLVGAGALVVLWYFLSGCAWVVGRLSSILLPPVVGVVLSMLLRPLYVRLHRWLGKSHALAIAILLLALFVPGSIALHYFGRLILRQGLAFIDQLPALLTQAETWFALKFPELQHFLVEHGVQTAFAHYYPDAWVTDKSALLVGGHLYSFARQMFGWALLPVYTAFFLATRPLDGSDMRELLAFASPKTRENAAFLVDQFFSIVVSFFRGQVTVSFIMGLYYGIAYQAVMLPYGLLIGLLQGFGNVIPYLGTFLGGCAAVAMAFLGAGGGAGLFVRVAAVFLVGQVLDLYLITPRIMKNRTGLSAIVIIFSLFFWNAVIGGILGVILAIPLSAFIVVFWRLLKREYFPKSPDASC